MWIDTKAKRCEVAGNKNKIEKKREPSRAGTMSYEYTKQTEMKTYFVFSPICGILWILYGIRSKH